MSLCLVYRFQFISHSIHGSIFIFIFWLLIQLFQKFHSHHFQNNGKNCRFILKNNFVCLHKINNCKLCSLEQIKRFSNSNMIIYSAWDVVQIAITWYSLIFQMIAIACRTDVIFQDYHNHSLVTKSNDLTFFCSEEMSWNKVISAWQ